MKIFPLEQLYKPSDTPAVHLREDNSPSALSSPEATLSVDAFFNLQILTSGYSLFVTPSCAGFPFPQPFYYHRVMPLEEIPWDPFSAMKPFECSMEASTVYLLLGVSSNCDCDFSEYNKL